MSRFPQYLRQQHAAKDRANVDRATRHAHQADDGKKYPGTAPGDARLKALWDERRTAAIDTELDAIQRGLTYQQQQARLGRPPNRDPETITL